MTAIPERRRENLLRVELLPDRFYVFRIKRGNGPVHLSLDGGRFVTVHEEGVHRVVRVQEKVGGWIWRYEDESDRVEWSFIKLPGDPLYADPQGEGS